MSYKVSKLKNNHSKLQLSFRHRWILMDTDDGWVSELNRDTIQFTYRAAGAACRPGVRISHSGACNYLFLSAFNLRPSV
jgi:hypothetical protein